MTQRQVEILMESFKADPYPRKKAIDTLAKLLKISRRKIQVWFSNMRQKKTKEGVLKKSEYIVHFVCTVHIKKYSSTS